MMSAEYNLDNEVDIYGDLPLIPNQDEEVNKLQDSKKKLEEEVRELKAHLDEVTKKNIDLESKYQTLGKNISSLFKTATAEIERKDRMIGELRKEQDNLVFRRNRNGGSGGSKTQPNSDSNPTDNRYSRNCAYGEEQQPELQSSECNYRENQWEDKNLENANDVCHSSEQYKEYTPDYSQPDEHYLELDYEDSLESYSKDDHVNYLKHEHNWYVNESTLKSQNDSPMTLFSQRQKQRAALKLKEEFSKSSETDNETQYFKQSAELAPLSDTSSNTAKNSISSQIQNKSSQSQNGSKTGDLHAKNSFSKENEIQIHKVHTLDGSLSDSNLLNEFRKPENRPSQHMSAFDNQSHEVHVNLYDDEQPECSSFEESIENSLQNSRCFSPNQPQKTIKSAELSHPSSYVPDPLIRKQYKIPKRIRETSVSRALRNLRNRSRSRSLMRSPPKHGFMAKRNKSYVRLSPSKCSKYSSRSDYHGKTRDSHSPDTSDWNNRFKKYDSHMHHPSPHSAKYSSRSMHRRSNSRDSNYDFFHHNSKRMDRNSAPYPLKSRSSNNFTRSELKFCDSKMKDDGFSQNKLRENDRHSSHHQKAKFSDNIMISKGKESYRNAEERDHDSFYKRKGYGKELSHNVISSHARRDSEELDRNSQETDHDTSYKTKGKTKDPSHIVKNSSTRYESKELDRNSKEVDIDSIHKRKDSNKNTSHKLETRSSDRSESTESDRNSKQRDHHSSFKTKGTNKVQPDNVISSCARIESKDSDRNSKGRDHHSSIKTKGTNKDQPDNVTSSCARIESKDSDRNSKERDHQSSIKKKGTNKDLPDNVISSCARIESKDSDRNSKERDHQSSIKTKGTNKDLPDNVISSCARIESKDSDRNSKERDHQSSIKTKGTNKDQPDNVISSCARIESKDSDRNSKERDHQSSIKTKGTNKDLPDNVISSCARIESKDSDRNSKERDHQSSIKTKGTNKDQPDNVISSCARIESKDSDRNSKERDHQSSIKTKGTNKDQPDNVISSCARIQSKDSDRNSKERDHQSSIKTKGTNKDQPDNVISSCARIESKDSDRNSKERDHQSSIKTKGTNKDQPDNVISSCARIESKDSDRNSKERDHQSSIKKKGTNKDLPDNVISSCARIESKDSDRNSKERDHQSSIKTKGTNKDLPDNVISSCARIESKDSDRNSKERDHQSSIKTKGTNKDQPDNVISSCARIESKDSDRNSKERDHQSSIKTKGTNKDQPDNVISSRARIESKDSDRNSKERDHQSSIKTKGTNKDQPDNVISSCARIESKDSDRNSKERDHHSSIKTKGTNKDQPDNETSSCARIESKDSDRNSKERDHLSSIKTKGTNKDQAANVISSCARIESKDSDRNSKESDHQSSIKTKGTNKDQAANVISSCARIESKDSDRNSKEMDHQSSIKTKGTNKDQPDNVISSCARIECKDSDRNSKERDHQSSIKTKGTNKDQPDNVISSCARIESTESDRNSKDWDHHSSFKTKGTNKDQPDNVTSSCARIDSKDSDRNSKESDHHSSIKTKGTNKDQPDNETSSCARIESKDSDRNSKERDHLSSIKTKGTNKDQAANVISSCARIESKDSDRNSKERDHQSSIKTKGTNKDQPDNVISSCARIESKDSDRNSKSCARIESKDSDRNSKERDLHSSIKTKGTNKDQAANVISSCARIESKASDRNSKSCARIESKDSDRNSKERDYHSCIKTKGTNKDQAANVISSCARIESKDSDRYSKERDHHSSIKTKGTNKDQPDIVTSSCARIESKDSDRNSKERDHHSSIKTKGTNKDQPDNVISSCARIESKDSDRNSKERDQDSSHKIKGRNKDLRNSNIRSDSKDLEPNLKERDHNSSCKTKDSNQNTSYNLETKSSNNRAGRSSIESDRNSKERDNDKSHNTKGSNEDPSHNIKNGTIISESKELDKSTGGDHCSSKKTKGSSDTKHNLEINLSDNYISSECKELNKNSKEGDIDSSHNTNGSIKCLSHDLKSSSTRNEIKELDRDSTEMDHDSSHKAKDNSKNTSLNLETMSSDNCVRHESDRHTKEGEHNSSQSNKDPSYNVKHYCTKTESKESKGNSKERDEDSLSKAGENNDPSHNIETKLSENFTRNESKELDRNSKTINYDLSHKTNESNKDSLHKVKASGPKSESKDSGRNSREGDQNSSYKMVTDLLLLSSKTKSLNNISIRESTVLKIHSSERNYFEDQAKECDKDSLHHFKSDSVAQEVSEGNSKQEEIESSYNMTEETSTVFSSLQLKSNSSHKTVRNNNYLKNMNDDSSYSKVKESNDLSHNKEAKLPDNVAQSKLKLCDTKQYPDVKIICKESKLALENVLTFQPKPKVPTAEHETLPSSELSESHLQKGYDSETFYYNSLFYKPEEEPINWHLEVIDVDSSKFVSRTKILDMIKKNAPHVTDKASSVRAESKSELTATEISNSTGLALGGKDSEQVITVKTNENSLSETSFKTSKSPNLNTSNLVLSDVSLSEHCEFKRRKKCRIKQFSCDDKEIVQSINKPRTNILHISTSDNRGFKRQLSNEEVKAVQPVAKRQALDNVAPTDSTNIKEKDCSIEKMERNLHNLSPCLQKDDELNKRKLKKVERTGSNKTYSNKHRGRNDGKDFETPEKIENKITDISVNIIDMHSQGKENTIHMQTDKQEENTDHEEGEISNDSISESEVEKGKEESTLGFKVNSPTHASSNSEFKLQSAKRHSFSLPRSKYFIGTNQQRFLSPVKKKFGRYSLPKFSSKRLQFLNVKKKRLKSNARGFEEDSRNGNSHQEENIDENEKNTSSNVIAPCNSVKKKGELCKDVSTNKDIFNEECHKNIFYKSSTTIKDSVQQNREKSKDEKYGDRLRRDEKCWKSQEKNISDNDSSGNTTNTLFEQGNQTDFIDAGNKVIQTSVDGTQTNYKQKEYSEEVQSDTISLEDFESPKKRNIIKIMQPRVESLRQNEAEKEENVRSASKKINEKCNSPVPFGHEAKRKSAHKRKINANLINTDKVLKNVADFTCTKKQENRENGRKNIIPSGDSTNKLKKEVNESSITSNCETNIKIKIQDNNDVKAVEVKPTDKSLEINMKAKSNLSCSTRDETVTKHKEHKIFNVSSPVSDMSNCHRLSQCTSKEICDGTPVSGTRKLHSSFEDKHTSQGIFSGTTSDNSFSDMSPVCVSRHRVKRRSRTCKLGDSSVVSINISPRTLENNNKVGTVRDVSVDSTEIKNMNPKLESTMHCNRTDESRFKPSVSSENSGSLENKITKKDKSYKCATSSVNNIVKNNRSNNSNSNTDTSTKPTTINTRKSNYKTSLDFRKKYASVFAHYSQESDMSSNEDEFVSSSSSCESDSDETWRPSVKRKRRSRKSKLSQGVKRGTEILKK